MYASCSMSRHVARPCRRCAPRIGVRGVVLVAGGVSTSDPRTSASKRGEGAPLRRGASCAHDGAMYERDCTRASPARRSGTQREVAGVSDQAPRGVLGCARSGHRARGVCGCRCRTSSRPCSSQPTGKSGGTLRQVRAAPGPARSS